MTDMDRSDEPIVLATSVVKEGDFKQEIIEAYVPPLDGTVDELNAFDMRIAKAVARVLVKSYPGYSWLVTSESRQGIVHFCIPELMGPSLKYVIKLGQFSDLTPQFVMICAGELLERMGLRRGAIDLGEYMAAKNNKEKFDFSDVRGHKRAAIGA